jgi:hypothetical protein
LLHQLEQCSTLQCCVVEGKRLTKSAYRCCALLRATAVDQAAEAVSQLVEGCYADVIIAGLADVKATQAVGGASAYTVEMHLPLHIYR